MPSYEFGQWFDSMIDWIGDNELRLALTFLTLLLIWKFTRRTGRMMDSLYKTMDPYVEVQDPQRMFVEQLLNWLFYVIALALVLFYWGVSPAFYATLIGLSITGLVVGLSSRDILANLLSGLILTLEKPFAKGDLVETEEFIGNVRGVTMRSTILETLDGQTVRIPNSQFMVKPLVNHSHNNQCLTDITLTLAAETDVELALELLRKVPTQIQWETPVQKVEVQIVGIVKGCAVVELSCWVSKEEINQAHTLLYLEVLKVLPAQGILLEGGGPLPHTG